MKKCLVISVGKVTGQTIAHQLQKILGEGVEVSATQIKYREEYNQEAQKHIDLILFTSDVSYMGSRSLENVEVPFVIGARVINHKTIGEIISIAAGSEVLLLNDSEESAIEAIKQLKDLGLDHLTYYPCFPGARTHPKLPLVITPGEPQLMPPCCKTLIDIGTRILDLKTVYKIKEMLGLEGMIHDSLVISYIKDIIGITRSIDKSRKAEQESKQVLEMIFDTVDSGIGFLTKELEVLKINSKLQHILEINRRDIVGKKMSTVIPSINSEDIKREILHIEIKGASYIINFEQVQMNGEESYLMTVYAVDKIKEMDQSTYGRVITGGLENLKTFDDYLSICPEVASMLKQAERFAKTDATITIQGENGTGKEIIAQGIHRHSYRKNKPFVPVNIAAISHNLLESELFGYEKGAFTGASKEGKIGLFEVANGGTLFIDEVGDAPMDIQVKLLRVLQEKKIRRVGGIEEIPVDVRIISATNKDLLALVDKDLFREDLYFRLNILPLYTIPLRLRGQDINHLLKYFMSIYFEEHIVTDLLSYFDQETLHFLNHYRWRGNVRELINLVEYLSYIYEGRSFVLSDLPKYYLSQEDRGRLLSEDEVWLLKQVLNYPGCGRSSLSKYAKEQAYALGEGQIRRLSTLLQSQGMLKTEEGKRGLHISEKGRRLLGKYL